MIAPLLFSGPVVLGVAPAIVCGVAITSYQLVIGLPTLCPLTHGD
jgi:hypothetical protein